MFVNNLRTLRRASGFTLVELLVTVLIVTVGLLGLAKLQATAVSETSVARTRALMTFQAESLADMMRANKAFWVTVGGPYPSFNVSAAGVATNTQMVQKPGGCVDLSGTNTCQPPNLAYDDMMTNWGPAFALAFPGAQAAIVCVPASGTGVCSTTTTTPNSYDIVLTWSEKMVAMNRSTSSSTTQTQTMVMHVQP